jgi:hypothetical protein
VVGVTLSTDGVAPYDVVVALVSGVLLVAVLNRPTLSWPTKTERQQRLREIALSGFAFFVGGYAVAALNDVLRRTSFPTDALVVLWSAGLLIGIYALGVHAEPFIRADKFHWVRYFGWTGGWMFLGIVACDLSIYYITWPDLPFLAIGFWAVIISWLAIRRFDWDTAGFISPREIVRRLRVRWMWSAMRAATTMNNRPWDRRSNPPG